MRRVETGLGANDRRWLWGLAFVTIAVRAWFIFVHRLDSDEPQHLHIAWAWSQGLVQYRDVFDNHLPLLHLLFAPIIALAPESSAVFVFMRTAIAPIAIACSVALFLFARPLWGTRTAAAAALLFSVMPPWFSRSVEFRNDTLWILFWLVALALRRSPFWMGVALGLSLLASIKAVPLVIAHGLALACERRAISLQTALRAALGAALPVLVTSIAMLAMGALRAMVFDTLLFNASAPVSPARRIGGAIAFVIVGAAIVFFAKRMSHWTLFAAWYVSLLLAFWPIVTTRDFLPIVPLVMIAVAARLPHQNVVLAICVLLAVLASVIDVRLWRRTEPFRERFVDAVVAVTDRNDFVVDLKGDAVFRRRAVRYIYEDVGRALTERGALGDDGPEEIVARGGCVAVRDSPHLPPRTRAFLNRHFVDAGLLRVCGTRVAGGAFAIAVPQTYALVAGDPARVRVDGIPWRGARFLAAGVHTITNEALTSESNQPVALIWWRAAKEGR